MHACHIKSVDACTQVIAPLCPLTMLLTVAFALLPLAPATAGTGAEAVLRAAAVGAGLVGLVVALALRAKAKTA